MFCNDNVYMLLHSHKKCASILLVILLLGFLMGSIFGWIFRFLFVRIIYQNLVNEIDFFTQLLILSLVFILPFVLRVFGGRVWVYCLSLLEGSAFAFVLVGLIAAFPQYGWLFAFLFLLPKTLLLILQFFYWRICLLFSTSAALKLLTPFLVACLPVLVMKDHLIKPTIFFLLNHL